MNNIRVCRKFPIKNSVVDLRSLNWAKFEVVDDEKRPYQITLIVMNDKEGNTMYPYERYIRSTEHYKAKNEDLSHCDNCSLWKTCDYYSGSGKCKDFSPMPRESIIVTQESGFVWIIFDTKDLMKPEKTLSECPSCGKKTVDFNEAEPACDSCGWAQ